VSPSLRRNLLFRPILLSKERARVVLRSAFCAYFTITRSGILHACFISALRAIEPERRLAAANRSHAQEEIVLRTTLTLGMPLVPHLLNYEFGSGRNCRKRQLVERRVIRNCIRVFVGRKNLQSNCLE
jgi:hypothetical protein